MYGVIQKTKKNEIDKNIIIFQKCLFYDLFEFSKQKCFKKHSYFGNYGCLLPIEIIAG